MFTLYDDLDAHRITKGQVIFGDALPERLVRHLIALYDGEIARTDAAVGDLLDRLARLPDPLLVVLTADHGESLGEHGYHFAHGEYLYQPGLHVPLLVRFPGVLPAGVRTAGAALNIDIAPTILALAGIDRLQGVEGRPLVAAAAGGGRRFVPVAGRTVTWAESDFMLIHPENPRHFLPGPAGRWTSASDGRYKLIDIPRPGDDLLELYDLQSDPGETRNLADRPDLATARARLLREVKKFADYAPAPGTPTPETLTPEERERLRSLGYIN